MPEIRTVFTQFNNNPSNEHYDNVPDLKFTTWNGYDHPKWIGDGTYNGGSYNSDMVNTANGLDYLFANKIQRANEAVKEQYIASGAVTSIKIKKDAVISEKIADLNVTSGKIADLAVNTTKIASAAVNGEKIAPLSITSGHIAEGGIPWSKITTPNTETGEGINTEDIANGAVTSEKLASGATAAVVSGTIRDGHVTSGKIADRAVTEIKIATGAVLSEHLSANSLEMDRLKVKDILEGGFGTSGDYNSTLSTIGNVKVTADKLLTKLHATSGYFNSACLNIKNHNTISYEVLINGTFYLDVKDSPQTDGTALGETVALEIHRIRRFLIGGIPQAVSGIETFSSINMYLPVLGTNQYVAVPFTGMVTIPKLGEEIEVPAIYTIIIALKNAEITEQTIKKGSSYNYSIWPTG